MTAFLQVCTFVKLLIFLNSDLCLSLCYIFANHYSFYWCFLKVNHKLWPILMWSLDAYHLVLGKLKSLFFSSLTTSLNRDISSVYEFNPTLCVHAFEQEARWKVLTKCQNPPSINYWKTNCMSTNLRIRLAVGKLKKYLSITSNEI